MVMSLEVLCKQRLICECAGNVKKTSAVLPVWLYMSHFSGSFFLSAVFQYSLTRLLAWNGLGK
jgi:hypothetical protein